MKRIAAFFSFVTLGLLALPAFAADAPEHGSSSGAIAIAAALAIGIAAFGGALGQGKAAAVALESIGRNPQAQNKIFTPMILGLALIESLVIYALIIAFQLLGKV